MNYIPLASRKLADVIAVTSVRMWEGENNLRERAQLTRLVRAKANDDVACQIGKAAHPNGGVARKSISIGWLALNCVRCALSRRRRVDFRLARRMRADVEL